MAAVTATLLIAPKDSKVTICTDNKSTIDQFNRSFKEQCYTYPHSIFKEKNRIFWSILYDISRINNITLSFRKIKAHTRNIYNERVDTLAKDALNLPILSFITTSSYIKYEPKWKNIIIDTHLQHFIKHTSYNKGFANGITYIEIENIENAT
ncbi:1548_t:CDS:1 [Entrophospora sp. SA101]|nr:1548_t:CDS:1 [Entrophospora sp. SA101]